MFLFLSLSILLLLPIILASNSGTTIIPTTSKMTLSTFNKSNNSIGEEEDLDPFIEDQNQNLGLSKDYEGVISASFDDRYPEKVEKKSSNLDKKGKTLELSTTIDVPIKSPKNDNNRESWWSISSSSFQNLEKNKEKEEIGLSPKATTPSFLPFWRPLLLAASSEAVDSAEKIRFPSSQKQNHEQLVPLVPSKATDHFHNYNESHMNNTSLRSTSLTSSTFSEVPTKNEAKSLTEATPIEITRHHPYGKKDNRKRMLSVDAGTMMNGILIGVFMPSNENAEFVEEPNEPIGEGVDKAEKAVKLEEEEENVDSIRSLSRELRIPQMLRAQMTQRAFDSNKREPKLRGERHRRAEKVFRNRDKNDEVFAVEKENLHRQNALGEEVIADILIEIVRGTPVTIIHQ